MSLEEMNTTIREFQRLQAEGMSATEAYDAIKKVVEPWTFISWMMFFLADRAERE